MLVKARCHFTRNLEGLNGPVPPKLANSATGYMSRLSSNVNPI